MVLANHHYSARPSLAEIARADRGARQEVARWLTTKDPRRDDVNPRARTNTGLRHGWSARTYLILFAGLIAWLQYQGWGWKITGISSRNARPGARDLLFTS